MTKVKHTPGPWLAIEEGGAAEPAIISGDEIYIASAHVGMKDWDSVTWANARLIAAAPDLLEALELWRAKVSGPGAVSMQTLLHMTDAAIAKAKGEA
jgi:hypothetical protein